MGWKRVKLRKVAEKKKWVVYMLFVGFDAFREVLFTENLTTHNSCSQQ
jgi:hypothetical protein